MGFLLADGRSDLCLTQSPDLSWPLAFLAIKNNCSIHGIHTRLCIIFLYFALPLAFESTQSALIREPVGHTALIWRWCGLMIFNCKSKLFSAGKKIAFPHKNMKNCTSSWLARRQPLGDHPENYSEGGKSVQLNYFRILFFTNKAS